MFRKLFGSGRKTEDLASNSRFDLDAACGDGDCYLPIVGESNYMPALEKLKARKQRRVRVRVSCEPTNRYDPNAISSLLWKAT